MIGQAHDVALPRLGGVHGHGEVQGAHGHVGGGPVHEVVYALGGVLAGVGVVSVAEGSEPGVPRGLGVPVDQRVGHDGRQEAVGLALAGQRERVDVTGENFDIGIGRVDQVDRFYSLHVSDEVVVPVGVVGVGDQVGGEEVDGELVGAEEDSGATQAFLNKDLT